MTVPASAHDAASWRPVAWILLMTAMFVALLLATAYTASLLTMQVGIADPEREHFAVIMTILFAAALTVAVPLTGRLFDMGRWVGPGPLGFMAYALAVAASYVIFADSRSGYYLDVDHALPEILVPDAIVLLASADHGHRAAATDRSRRAWSFAVVLAGLALLALVAMTADKIADGAMGMYRLDSPLTLAALLLAGAYGIAAPALRLIGERRGPRPRGER